MARGENNSRWTQSQEVSKYEVAAGQRAAFQPHHARRVPKRAKLNASQKGPLHPPTTMMLRNIPMQYTQSALREELDHSGFADSYDFFYLPMDIKNHTSVGYAFVNFLNSSDATRFFEAFSGYKFNLFRSKKIGEVSTAFIQGLENNLKHFQNKAVSNGHYHPVVVMAGQLVDMDQALAKLSGKSNSKVSLTNFMDPCPSPLGHPVHSVMQQAVSTMHHCEAHVPTALSDPVACSSGKQGPVGSGLSKHGRTTGQQLCLADYVCPEEPRYITPGAFSSDPAMMVSPPPGLESYESEPHYIKPGAFSSAPAMLVRPTPALESPESWRPSALPLPPQDRTTSLQDALKSMQKLSLNSDAQKNASTVFDEDSATPRTHVSLLAECYRPVGSNDDELSW